MGESWVYKADGTLQCGLGVEVSLEEMLDSLVTLIGRDEIISFTKARLPVLIPALCGAPTGTVNVYKLTSRGLHMLFRGIVGPIGFALWIWDAPASANSGDSTSPPHSLSLKKTFSWPFDLQDASIEDLSSKLANIVSSLTQAGGLPTTVSELYGRQCRIYKQGDSLTFDLMPGRVNIELTDHDTIHRIWFG